MCDRGGRKLVNLSSFLSGQGEIKMDTSTEKHNFPHSKLEKEEDILEQLCIWKTQNISLDLAFQNGEKRYSGVSQEDAKGRIS